MKKITLVFTILVSSLTFAQTTTTHPHNTTDQAANVTLNVKLHPIQTIYINGSNVVDIEMLTKDDYTNPNGKTVSAVEHINVFSVGAFAVQVQALSSSLAYATSSSKSIPLANIKITMEGGTEQTLSQEVTTLLTKRTGSNNEKFDVTYRAIADPNTYVNQYINGEDPTVYTTNLQYSIIAQ